MVHTLRKYLSNRGSALFMVLSTMTALMVCCMAMYFSVISSRSTQYAIFNQQQAYQSATSLSDTIIAGMISGKNEFKDISSKIWNLGVNEKITTNSNGFSAFSVDGTGKADDDQVGSYMITITRLEDETLPDATTVKVFDIVITSSVNGTKEVFHNIIQMTESTSKVVPPGPTNPFTATGYVPNDVFLDCGSIRTDVFFDNQMTYGRAYGTAKMELFGDLSCGGSFHLKNNLALKAAYPTCFAVRDTFTSDATGPQEFFAGEGATKLKKNKNTSMVLIGGDCILNDAGTFKGANVYVLGDLHLSSRYPTEGKKAYIYDDVTMYVDGNVYIHDAQGHNLSQVYCNGSVIRDIPTTDGSPESIAGKWTGTAQGYEVDGLLTVKEMLTKLDEKTSTNTYYKWEVEIPSGKEDKSSLTDENGVVTDGIVRFSADNTNKRPTVFLEYTEDHQGVEIKDVTVNHPNNGGYTDLTLVIDTGDDPDNIYTVKLNGNRNYLDGPVDKETFCWMPRNTSATNAIGATSYLDYGNNCTFKILVMGRGSVVFDIPEGITYQDDWFIRVMHYGWYALAEGEEVYFGGDKTGKTKKYIVEHTVYKNPAKINSATLFSKFVHTHCDAEIEKKAQLEEGKTPCEYTDETLADECTVCGKKMIGITCAIHGYVGKYCEDCQPNQFIKDDTQPNKKRYEGKCSKRVDRPSIDKYLVDHPSILTNHKYMTDSEGLIYPNVNIFLVSCDENANIRLSVKDISDPETDPVKDYKNRFQSNLFAGYIYAPYMTMKMQVGGNLSGGDSVRLMGGMTVSDYIIDDDYAMIAIWPDKLPEEMMPESCKKNPLIGTASKSWKIALKAH